MGLALGRQGRTYGGLHAAFGDTPEPTAANAFRHIQLLLGGDPFNRRNSPEKRFSPVHSRRFDGRETGDLRQVTALMRPSGTLNTLPEASFLFEAAFGSKTNVTLSTTVSNGTGAVGGATLASATGLAVHDHVLITCTDGVKRVRRLTAANTGTGVVAWAPNLPEAPADGAAVKAGITYKMTTANALAFWLLHYLKQTDASTAALNRMLLGAHADKFSLAIDGSDESQFTVNGKAQLMTTVDVPAQPGGFTEVGGNPPAGWQSECWIGNDLYRFMKMACELTNGLELRNNEAGAGASNRATESYRKGDAAIQFSLDARLETKATIYDRAEAGTDIGLFLQQGFTEGNIWTVALPRVEWKVPDTDDPQEEVNWPFKGMGLNSTDSVNDAIFLAFL